MESAMSKFVILTGGVVSSLGKGTTAGSLGRLLKNRGVKVTMQKFDPYLNVDPGTMSPYQHGEVFITDDGAETDLDIGHYERFLDINLGRANNITSGRIYSSVINKERMGKYGGATVQTIPHITTEVKDCMLALTGDDVDIVIVEIGGIVSDYETGIYLHAIRQLQSEVGEENVFLLHVDLLPFIGATGETKFETVQSSIQRLNSFGISPDTIVCRTSKDAVMNNDVKTLIAKRCFLKGPEYVVQNADAETVYEIPITLQKEGLDNVILKKFGMNFPKSDLNSWSLMVNNFKAKNPEIRICIVGKYTKVADAYLSVEEAINHACTYNQVKAKIDIIDAEDIEEVGAEKFLKGAKAIIVPAGWGSRGFKGMIEAIRYARESKIPYLGIGFGMQLAIVEFGRNVLRLSGANTTEIDPDTEYPVIDVMKEQKKILNNGVNTRIGSCKCVLDPASKSAKLYGKELVTERHRHSYEFNTAYYDKYASADMIFAGMNPDSKLVEIVELKTHPYFVGVIFEPENKSRPNRPHPLFLGLINTAKSIR
ncbi:MAG: CTP synthase [Clostridia bacterium]|nr:CTP synthase [Clostridia bacterium]